MIKVNYELTVDIAEKAKKKGVKQFIFMSTMAVYGKSEGEIKWQHTFTAKDTLWRK